MLLFVKLGFRDFAYFLGCITTRLKFNGMLLFYIYIYIIFKVVFHFSTKIDIFDKTA